MARDCIDTFELLRYRSMDGDVGFIRCKALPPVAAARR